MIHIRKLFISLLIVNILFISIIPKDINAVGGAVFRIIGGTALDQGINAIGQKAGVKYANKSAQEKALAYWNQSLIDNGVLDPVTKQRIDQKVVAMKTDIENAPLRPNPNKQGWGKKIIKAASWITGVSMIYSGYKAFQEAYAQQEYLNLYTDSLINGYVVENVPIEIQTHNVFSNRTVIAINPFGEWLQLDSQSEAQFMNGRSIAGDKIYHYHDDYIIHPGTAYIRYFEANTMYQNRPGFRVVYQYGGIISMNGYAHVGDRLERSITPGTYPFRIDPIEVPVINPEMIPQPILEHFPKPITEMTFPDIAELPEIDPNITIEIDVPLEPGSYPVGDDVPDDVNAPITEEEFENPNAPQPEPETTPANASWWKWLLNPLTKILELLQNWFDWIRSIFPQLFTIINAILSVLNTLWEYLSNFINLLETLLNSIFSQLQSFLSDLFAPIISVLNTLSSWLQTFFNLLENLLNTLQTALINAITGLISGIVNQILNLINLIQSILNVLNNLVQSIMNALESLLLTLFVPTVSLSTAISPLITSVQDKFPAMEQVRTMFGAFVASCTSLENIEINLYGKTMTIVNFDYIKSAADWYKPIVSGLIWLFVGYYTFRKINAIVANRGGA